MSRLLLFAAIAAIPSLGSAKPIAFGDGYTFMTEYGAGTMQEAQLFYAPRYWYSGGLGFLRMESEDGAFSRDITYARLNLLAKRWNLPSAQANVFVWGGVGEASGTDFVGDQFASNGGFQLDYETLRVYGALKSELQHASAFSMRLDTLQLGWAPYAHDWDRMATWFLVQARTYTGRVYDGVETALLLRLFKGGAWIEAGLTQDGKVQAMAMFNF